MYRSLLARLESLNLSGITGHPTIPVPSDLLDKLAEHTKDQIGLIEQMLQRHEQLTYLLNGKVYSHQDFSEAHGILASVLHKFFEVQELIRETEKDSTSVQGHLHVRLDQLSIVSQESKTICNMMQHFQKIFGQAMDGITEDLQ